MLDAVAAMSVVTDAANLYIADFDSSVFLVVWMQA